MCRIATMVECRVKSKCLLVLSATIRLILLAAILLFHESITPCLASSLPTMLKLDGNSKTDLFLIGGKNCNTPTIIKQGRKGVFGSRAKLIFIEPECIRKSGSGGKPEIELVPLLVKKAYHSSSKHYKAHSSQPHK